MGVKVAFQEAGEVEAEASTLRGVLVPKAALRRDSGRDIVYVAASGKAERRAVSAREYRNDMVLIESGLQAGETVIVQAPAELADGVDIEEKKE
jgi:hypothetical protein